ncbi:hypothetical protein BUX97_02475 [Staphylococcus chromogenes]|nr:hypothetical protein [Staphylococcus chromogenes]PTF76789.1 hypothetical protein BUX97_02475 [Staphylococcus chromogenes]PTF80197.1 hypothetical protein BU686_05490 [Staphylococcus chromogenes]PTG59196.1 hypothetical protein BU682_06060 [Staphylococcus chromogenes]RIM17694.1 hypothetical protein BU681_03545 [Staphylococcus chromogenes]
MEELDKRFSKRKMIQIYDKALIAAGNEVLKAVKANIRYFRDTGAEYGEAKLSKPEWEKGLRSVRVYWEGPQHRYSVVHLNEKGFYARNGKFIRPKGMGAIDNAIRSSRQTFYKVVEQEVSKLL